MGISKAQKRASFAFDQVASLNKEDAECMKTEAAKIIALILNSGILQAMDFAFASKNLSRAYGALKNWLMEEDPENGPGLPVAVTQAAKEGSINEALAKIGKEEYQLVMQEALAFLECLKSKAGGRAAQLSCDSQKKEDTEDAAQEIAPTTEQGK